MQIAKPMSEEEIELSILLPEGVYDFTVKEAEERQSKKGNDMIVAVLQVFRPTGGFALITDYLLEAMAFKLRHFCEEVGMLDEYNSGTLAAENLQGISGKVTIGIEPAQGQYRAKNTVQDYGDRGGDKKPAAKKEETSAKTPSDDDDEIPF